MSGYAISLGFSGPVTKENTDYVSQNKRFEHLSQVFVVCLVCGRGMHAAF